MKVEIVDFKPEHFDIMDMRDYEVKFKSKLVVLADASIESKTAIVDGEIWTTWGIIKDSDGYYFWQVPSKLLKPNTMAYARRAYKVIRKMIENYEDAYTFCLDDKTHADWMRFIGFKPNRDVMFKENGNNHILYEVI